MTTGQPEGMVSSLNTAQRPASASNSSGVPRATSPERLKKPTPVGTFSGNALNTERARSVSSSTKRTRCALRPRVTVPAPAARALSTQSAFGYPVARSGESSFCAHARS